MRQYVAAVTIKGQVTIPVEVRRLLGVSRQGKVAFVVEDGEVRIVPATSVVERTAGMLAGGPPRSIAEETADMEAGMASEAERVPDAAAVS